MPSNQRTTTISRRQQLRDQRARESAKETKRRRLFRIATGLLTTLIVALVVGIAVVAFQGGLGNAVNNAFLKASTAIDNAANGTLKKG